MNADDSPFDEDAADSEGPDRPQDDNADQWRDAWPQIEALIESSGRHDKLNEEVAAYIKVLATEETENRLARKISVIVIAIFILVGWSVIYCLIVKDWGYFFLIGSNARVAVLAGWSIMTGLFIVVLLRGMFRIASERHLNGLPENIRAIIEGIQN